MVCVEYGGPGTPRFSKTLEYDLLSPAEHWAVFLDTEVVGTLCYSYEFEKLCISAINRTTLQQTTIVTDLPSPVKHLATLPFSILTLALL